MYFRQKFTAKEGKNPKPIYSEDSKGRRKQERIQIHKKTVKIKETNFLSDDFSNFLLRFRHHYHHHHRFKMPRGKEKKKL